MNLRRKTPFVYGKTVSSKGFTNREGEVDHLLGNFKSGINTVIISPRRWGKSSLVEKVVLKLKKEQEEYIVVNIDLFSVGSKKAFLELFTREVIKSSSNKWEEWVASTKAIFSAAVPNIQLGVDPQQEFSIGFDWKTAERHIDEMLNLPEVVAKRKKRKMIICIDEFQNIAQFEGFKVFEKQMRASWQRQKSVTYCLYGSQRHMMRDIFNKSTKPFYRFGDIVLLQKIAEEKWLSFIKNGFKRTGKLITSDNAVCIARLMKNHPWYVQQLSHYVWNRTKDEVNESAVQLAIDELIHANAPLYYLEIENLSATQINLLKAVLKGEQRLTSVSVMREYALGTPNNVRKNISALQKRDVIHKQGDGPYELLDPAFEIWCRMRFLKADLKQATQGL